MKFLIAFWYHLQYTNSTINFQTILKLSINALINLGNFISFTPKLATKHSLRSNPNFQSYLFSSITHSHLCMNL